MCLDKLNETCITNILVNLQFGCFDNQGTFLLKLHIFIDQLITLNLVIWFKQIFMKQCILSKNGIINPAVMLIIRLNENVAKRVC